LEAAINGVPTVAFAVGGVPDAVHPLNSGRLIAPGDYDAMARSIIEYLSTPADARTRAACIEFAHGFEWNQIGTVLVKAVTELAKP